MVVVRITLILSFLFAEGVVAMNSDGSELLDHAVSRVLNQVAAKDDKIAYKDGGILLAGKHVAIKPILEHALEKGSSHISAARFVVIVDGKEVPELIFGSIGIDQNPESAAMTAVVEWYMASGRSALAAIAEAEAAIQDGGRSVYAGPMGIRGDRPEDGWLDASDDMKRKIFSAIKQHIPAGTKFTGIDIKISVLSTGEISGQCLINGKESASALDELLKLEWPTTSAYLFKQALVVSHASQE